tara:strand:+ start:11835 stop:12866 length:1032 start_codon:yes stop_codon:yes gene_type:complete
MTNQNIYSIPKILLDGTTLNNVTNISYNNPGNNQLSSINFTINDPEYVNYRLLNKEVEFFVNEGGGESTSIFVGFIRDIKPSDTSVVITAYDCRTFISSRESTPIVMTDKKNYDGYSAVQFLVDVIKETGVDISLDMLSETNPPIPMSGLRSVNDTAYSLFSNLISRISDDDDPRNPLNYIIDVVGKSIVVTKKRVKGGTGIRFSRNDGIINMQINRRAPITKATVYGDNGSSGTFEIGNSPTGSIGTSITDTRFKNNAECTEAAIRLVMAERNEIDEIEIQVSKGYDLGLNNIVYLDVDDMDVRGEHRISSKKIQVSNDGISYVLGLDKLGPRTSDYILKGG